MKNQIKIHIGEANTDSAFITSATEADVAVLNRITLAGYPTLPPDYVSELLTDEQWQLLVNQVDALPELIQTLRNALDWCQQDAENEDSCPSQEMLDARAEVLAGVLARIENLD